LAAPFVFCVLYAKNLEGVEKGERSDWCPPPTNSDEGTHKEKIRSSLIITFCYRGCRSNTNSWDLVFGLLRQHPRLLNSSPIHRHLLQYTERGRGPSSCPGSLRGEDNQLRRPPTPPTIVGPLDSKGGYEHRGARARILALGPERCPAPLFTQRRGSEIFRSSSERQVTLKQYQDRPFGDASASHTSYDGSDCWCIIGVAQP
jgi:hypothetical protein